MKNEKDLLKLYDECLDFWGLNRQLRMTIEECSELILALCHFRRGRKAALDNVIEELADAQLMISQITRYVGEDKVKNMMDIKSNYINSELNKAKGIKEKADGV